MHFFGYKGKELYAEEAPVAALAEKYGTPLYVYSKKTLARHFDAWKKAFGTHPVIICYALKANSNGSILGVLARQGAGADIVSGGELFRALRAGLPSSRIVYAGVGKTAGEIRYALREKVLMLNVESAEELAQVDGIAGRMRLKAPIALRVNPDVDPKSHPYISTGMKKNKFGIPAEDAFLLYREAAGMKNIEITGIHQHIGSQLTEMEPFVDALERTLSIVEKLRKNGITLKYLDLGGGLGIPYREDENPPAPAKLVKRLMPLLKTRAKGLTIIIEPGRSIVGNAGVLVTRCLYVKETPAKNFIIVDAGMNDLARPSLYGSYHAINPVVKTRAPKITADVVGPICESGDFLAKDREIQKTSGGEYLAVMSAGAYGFSMASNYNSRPRPAEVLVDGAGHRLIRKRETWQSLVRGEL